MSRLPADCTICILRGYFRRSRFYCVILTRLTRPRDSEGRRIAPATIIAFGLSIGLLSVMLAIGYSIAAGEIESLLLFYSQKGVLIELHHR